MNVVRLLVQIQLRFAVHAGHGNFFRAGYPGPNGSL